MMSRIKIQLNTSPIAKKRPRFARIGKAVRTYDVQETEKQKTIALVKKGIKKFIDEGNNSVLPLDSALYVKIYFYLPIPKSWSKKKKELAKQNLIHPTSRPDLDNYVKFYFDCFNGLLWVDDSQVVSVFAEKYYADGNPQVCLTIETLGDSEQKVKLNKLMDAIQALKEIEESRS